MITIEFKPGFDYVEFMYNEKLARKILLLTTPGIIRFVYGKLKM